MVYVPGNSLKLRNLLHFQKRCEQVSCVNSVKPALLYSMPASDEDPEHTNGRLATRRPTLDDHMVYVPDKSLKLRPF